MYIKGNAILGMVLSRYGLMLNDTGLYRKIRIKGNQNYHLFLTDDMNLVAELFDIDKEEFEESEYQEQLEYIYNSEYFRSELFIEDEDENMSVDIKFMARYVSIAGDKNMYLPIDTKRLMEVLGDNTLKDKIDYLKKTLPVAMKEYKGKFEEMKKVLINSGYDPRNFQEDLMNFVDNFRSRYEMHLFFYENNMNDIIKKYLSSSETEVNI